MRVNLARKVISSVLKIHLRHRAHDVLASQAKECRVCVPGREHFTPIGGYVLLSKCKYLLSKPTFVDNALSSSSVPCPRKRPGVFWSLLLMFVEICLYPGDVDYDDDNDKDDMYHYHNIIFNDTGDTLHPTHS